MQNQESIVLLHGKSKQSLATDKNIFFDIAHEIY